MRRLSLLGLAFGGSIFYGASLSKAIGADALASALWITLGAGLGWAALLPTLKFFSHLSWLQVLDACLITIGFGEAVLIIGGALNFTSLVSGTMANVVIVGISNLTMVSVLTILLSRRGFAPWKTLSAWMLALNGVGALAFWCLSSILFRGGL